MCPLTFQILTLDQYLWGKCKEVPSGIFGSQNERYQLLGSLSNDDGDGNKNGKKAVGLY